MTTPIHNIIRGIASAATIDPHTRDRVGRVRGLPGSDHDRLCQDVRRIGADFRVAIGKMCEQDMARVIDGNTLATSVRPEYWR